MAEVYRMVVIAGLNQRLFDKVAARPLTDVLGSNYGALIIEPSKKPGYTQRIADRYIHKISAKASGLHETTPIEMIVLVIDFEDGSTREFIDMFFPFALMRTIAWQTRTDELNVNRGNEIDNALIGRIRQYILEMADVCGKVREHTNLPNLCPFLLPVRNFQSELLIKQYIDFYHKVGNMGSACVRAFIKDVKKSINARHPKQQMTGNPSYYTDRQMIFKSPGKDRHAFFRYAKKGSHDPLCLLNARTRFGGSYDPTFHYDCEERRGGVRATYPGCHGHPCAPHQPTHVNISPNDFIR